MKRSSAEVINSSIEIVDTHMSDYLVKAVYDTTSSGSDKDFPCLLMFQNEAATSQASYNQFNLTFRCLDVAEALNNKKRMDYEVKSDMMLAASIFLDYLVAEGIIESRADIQLQPITISEGKGLSGIEFSLTIPIFKPCVVVETPAGNDPRYDFKANTVVEEVNSTTAITVNIDDVTTNTSGLSGTFVSAETTDTDLSLSISADLTVLTIQTDVLTDRYTNISFKATNSFVSSSSVIVANISDTQPKAGIAYPPKPFSGKTTTTYDYDEGYRYINGSFGPRNNPTNPLYFQSLDLSGGNETTLLHLNDFGNYDRFTDLTGGQTFTNDMYRDNYLNCLIYRAPQDTLLNLLANVPTTVVDGISGWEMANFPEVYTQLINTPGTRFHTLGGQYEANTIYSGTSFQSSNLTFNIYRTKETVYSGITGNFYGVYIKYLD